MSVFTTVTVEQLRLWLQNYSLGELIDIKGIASGITNTNYFVTTTSGRYVLTLFERNTADELPYFLDLMTHLSDHDIPCPHPVIRNDGASLGELNGKPAALVSCLRGHSIEMPSIRQCEAVGEAIARLHLAGASFPAQMENPRGRKWRSVTAAKVVALLDAEDRAMLENEVALHADLEPDGLPQGVIHADLFRDNVLFDGDALGGIIDFYYACNDALLYDLAITVNDWCTTEEGGLDGARLQALVKAYQAIRPLTDAEHKAWPGMLRLATLRFWLSRLYDMHFPQDGELTYAKDPGHFRRILAQHIKAQDAQTNLVHF